MERLNEFLAQRFIQGVDHLIEHQEVAVGFLHIFGPVVIATDRQHTSVKKRSRLLLIQCGAFDLIGIIGQRPLGIGIDPGTVKFLPLNPEPPDQFFIFHRKSLLVISLSLFYHTAGARYRGDFLPDLTEILSLGCRLSVWNFHLQFRNLPFHPIPMHNSSSRPAFQKTVLPVRIIWFHVGHNLFVSSSHCFIDFLIVRIGYGVNQAVRITV